MNAQRLINFRKNPDLPHIIDVELRELAYCRQFDSVEFHLVVFPYSRRVVTNDIQLQPFQDYVEDILQQQRSTYSPIPKNANKRFALFLSAVIIGIMYLFHPEDFASVEALVSVFGAYMVGKELWMDLERYLVNTTQKRRLRYTESYYSYQIEEATTLRQYSSFAMKHRYGEIALYPQQMEYLEQSSSKTVRLRFERDDFEVADDMAHLLSIRFGSDAVLEELEKDGYMLGVKLSFNKRKWWRGTQHLEYFQSWTKGERGCLDLKGEWRANALFYRSTYSAGRWKFFKAKGVEEGKDLIGFYE